MQSQSLLWYFRLHFEKKALLDFIFIFPFAFTGRRKFFLYFFLSCPPRSFDPLSFSSIYSFIALLVLVRYRYLLTPVPPSSLSFCSFPSILNAHYYIHTPYPTLPNSFIHFVSFRHHLHKIDHPLRGSFCPSFLLPCFFLPSSRGTCHPLPLCIPAH